MFYASDMVRQAIQLAHRKKAMHQSKDPKTGLKKTRLLVVPWQLGYHAHSILRPLKVAVVNGTVKWQVQFRREGRYSTHLPNANLGKGRGTP